MDTILCPKTERKSFVLIFTIIFTVLLFINIIVNKKSEQVNKEQYVIGILIFILSFIYFIYVLQADLKQGDISGNYHTVIFIIISIYLLQYGIVLVDILDEEYDSTIKNSSGEIIGINYDKPIMSSVIASVMIGSVGLLYSISDFMMCVLF